MILKTLVAYEMRVNYCIYYLLFIVSNIYNILFLIYKYILFIVNYLLFIVNYLLFIVNYYFKYL